MFEGHENRTDRRSFAVDTNVWQSFPTRQHHLILLSISSISPPSLCLTFPWTYSSSWFPFVSDLSRLAPPTTTSPSWPWSQGGCCCAEMSLSVRAYGGTRSINMFLSVCECCQSTVCVCPRACAVDVPISAASCCTFRHQICYFHFPPRASFFSFHFSRADSQPAASLRW